MAGDWGLTRRSVLALSGGVVGTLAGCTTDSSTNSPTSHGSTQTTKPPTTRTRTPTTTELTTETPTTTEAKTETSTTTTSASDLITVTKSGGRIRAQHGENGEEVASEDDARTVIQRAIHSVRGGGTVRLSAETFELRQSTLVVNSEIDLVGAGVGETVLKLADGVNKDAVPHVAFAPSASGARLADIEIDGNESNNRSIESFPNHPAAHGILLNGTDNSIENVAVHDTIASNLVVNGKRCTVQNVRLANSAADHWLYVTDAEHCTISDVTAGGFARGSGIVFSVTDRTCRHNTLSNVTISGATTTPMQHDNPGIRGRFPVFAVNLRDVGTAKDNTISNLSISNSNQPYGHQVLVAQPATTLEKVSYTGPIGGWRSFLRIGSPKRGSAGTSISDVTVEPTALVERGASTPCVVRSASSDVTLSNIDVTGCNGANLRGVVFDGEHRQVQNNTLADSSLETEGPVVVADGTTHPVTGIEIEDVEDVTGSGIRTKGDTSLSSKDLT